MLGLRFPHNSVPLLFIGLLVNVTVYMSIPAESEIFTFGPPLLVTARRDVQGSNLIGDSLVPVNSTSYWCCFDRGNRYRRCNPGDADRLPTCLHHITSHHMV